MPEINEILGPILDQEKRGTLTDPIIINLLQELRSMGSVGNAPPPPVAPGIPGQGGLFEKGLTQELPGGAITSGALELLPSLIPFTGAVKGMQALPFIGSKAFSAAKGVLPFILRNVINPSVRGASITAGAAAADPDMELTSKTAGIGAAFEAAPPLIGKSAKGTWGLFKNIVNKPLGVRNFTDLFNFIKNFRGERFGKGIEEFGEKAGVKSTEVAGREFQEGTKGILKEAGESYQNFMKPIREKFGNNKVSAERLRKAYVDKLDEFGLIDEKGNILEDSLELIFEPDVRSTFKKLTEQVQKLRSNPTFSELEQITTKIGKIAQFNKGTRKDKDLMFGKLFNESRENLLGEAENFVGVEGKEAIRNARASISRQLKVAEGELGELGKLRPEHAVERASTTGKLDLSSVVDEALEANKAFKEPLKKIVIADIMRTTNDTKTLRKALDLYKETLPKLLSQEELDQLGRLVSEEILSTAVKEAAQQGISATGQAGLRMYNQTKSPIAPFE